MPSAPRETLLNIRIYKFLLGTLSKSGVQKLKEELAERFRTGKTNSALETKLHAAFTTRYPTRKYLSELLNDWEKRITGTNS